MSGLRGAQEVSSAGSVIEVGVPPSAVPEGDPASVGALASLPTDQAHRQGGALVAATQRLALAFGMNENLAENSCLVHLEYDLYHPIADFVRNRARFALPTSGSCRMRNFGHMPAPGAMTVSDEGDSATCNGGNARAEIAVDSEKLGVVLAMPKASSVHIIYLRCEGTRTVCGMINVTEGMYEVDVHAPARSISIRERSSGRECVESLKDTDPVADLYLGVYLYDAGATVRVQ